MKRYEQVPHTADLAAMIYGEDLPHLFENAAYAMFSMMADIVDLKPDKSVSVKVTAPDMESLLISWLNELLYIAATENMLFHEFRVKELKDNKLVAKATGAKMGPLHERMREEIKAATYHDLKIKRTEKGYEVRVVFDV